MDRQGAGHFGNPLRSRNCRTDDRTLRCCSRGGRRRRALASGDLLERLELPQNVKAESLGMVRLRGKQQELELFALHRDIKDAKALPEELS